MLMNGNETTSPTREAALGGLAIVGFIALVLLGMWLAVYSARFVPATINRIGAAAVYVGSLFTPDQPANLTVIPTASTTLPFGDATTTATTTSVATTTKPAGQTTKPVTPTAGTQTSTTTELGTARPVLYGYPDLAVTITAVGYMTTSSTDSFVAATTVPHGAIPAVRFSVKNIGTNVAGQWSFMASIPTSNNSTYQSALQQTLNPGDYIDFTLGFSQPIPGSNQQVTINVNADRSVSESNTNNNSAVGTLTILGS